MSRRHHALLPYLPPTLALGFLGIIGVELFLTVLQSNNELTYSFVPSLLDLILYTVSIITLFIYAIYRKR